MHQRIIRNARIVTGSETFAGCVVVEGDTIRAIDPGTTATPSAEDWQGDWLLPGLV